MHMGYALRIDGCGSGAGAVAWPLFLEELGVPHPRPAPRQPFGCDLCRGGISPRFGPVGRCYRSVDEAPNSRPGGAGDRGRDPAGQPGVDDRHADRPRDSPRLRERPGCDRFDRLRQSGLRWLLRAPGRRHRGVARRDRRSRCTGFGEAGHRRIALELVVDQRVPPDGPRTAWRRTDRLGVDSRLQLRGRLLPERGRPLREQRRPFGRPRTDRPWACDPGAWMVVAEQRPRRRRAQALRADASGCYGHADPRAAS